MSTLPTQSAMHRAGRWCAWLSVVMLLAFASAGAQAVPAYARQTGNACADCHAVAYGPALTPYGIRFKLNGYTDTGGNGLRIPAAVQVIATSIDPTQGKTSTRLTEADLFLAGGLNDHVGGFAKIETDNDGHNNFQTRLNNVDLRFVAKDLKLGSKDAMFGVSVNNNPGFQDAIGALPNASGLGPPAVSGTLLNPSSAHPLNDRVYGATVYGLYDGSWYAEIGGYGSMSTSVQDQFGYRRSADPGRLSDTGYLRLAYMKDFKSQFFSLGVVALKTKRQLPRSANADDLTDLGYDLTYQYIGNRDHIVQLSFVSILEQRDYGSRPLIPFAPGVAPSSGIAHDRVLSLSYTFKQSYGVTLTHLVSTGSQDPARYPPYGIPDTTSNLYSVYWTPFGKEDSFTTIANIKIAATWFRFLKFNGTNTNIFGAPPGFPMTRARDLNAFALTVSAAF